MKILYFASLREKLGTGSEELSLPAGVVDIRGLIGLLAARGGQWEGLASVRNLRCAVNQEMAWLDSPIGSADEIAFFPPVTGG